MEDPVRQELDSNDRCDGATKVDGVVTADLLNARASDTALLHRPTEHCLVFPIPPKSVQRYDRGNLIQRTQSRFTIKPATTKFDHVAVPTGWTAGEHPEGALYFFAAHKLFKRIYTDAYIIDPKRFRFIVICLEKLVDKALTMNVDFSSNELVLDLQRSRDGDICCGYYLVDDDTRTLFWLEEFDASPLLTEVRGITSPSHIKHEIESQYWLHWELYPKHRDLTPALQIELKEILVHASGDSLTSQSSTSPYSAAELKKMMFVVNNMTVKSGDENGTGHSVCVFGRLMMTFVHQRFLNFHGQYGARLDRDVSVHGAENHRTIIGRIVSHILFFAPDTHLRVLEKIWVDDTICHVPWNKFIDGLTAEWRDYVLYGALLANANIAFLSIIPGGHDGDTMYLCARVATYASVGSSLGSVLLGMLLLRQYRTKVRTSAENALEVLESHRLEFLATIYSLPYALLLWGLVSFITAILFTCFQQTNTIALSITAGILLVIGMLVVMCVWVNWERWGHSLGEVFQSKATPSGQTAGTKKGRTTQWKWLNFGRRQDATYAARN